MGGHGPSAFGEILRSHRLRARLTQQQLAERSGVSVRALRYIERGTVGRPRPESVRRLAAAVGVSPEALAEQAAEHAPAPSARLGLGVLGAFSVAHGGRPVEVGAQKQRTLLALLALRANQPVRHEEVVDVLWGDRPPHTCLGLVHTYVSRLRRALAAAGRRHRGAIASVPGGYRLVVRTEQVDRLVFDDLATRADALRLSDPAAALELFDQALACWRGPVLADMTTRLRNHPTAIGLAVRRRRVALAHADLALALGRWDRVVDRVRPLAHEEPLHEGLHARLMLGLAGTGEQAAALRVFTDIRARLAEELGVAPGREIRGAHLRVLRAPDQPAPAAARPPAQLPADPPGFVGRAATLSRLDALLDREDGPVVAVVSGSAGVGKTALAVHWAHRVRDRFPDGQLSVDLRGYAARVPPGPREVLVRFLHALGVPPERVPVDPDEAIALYRTMLAGRKVLVLLDNAATAEQVRPLLPGAPGCLVLVTSRDRLTGLTARDGAHPVPLDVLDPVESVDLLGGVLGAGRTRREARAAAEMADSCGHLPLALRIAGANLAVRPGTSVADYTRELRARGRVAGLAVAGDESAAVRAAFDLSYDKLTPAARRLFRLLGLVPGADLDQAAAAALAGLTQAATTRLLGVLDHGNLIRRPAPGRYGFHDLLHEYARDRAEQEDAPAERTAAMTRLLDHYVDAVRVRSALLWQTGAPVEAGPEAERDALAWLDDERANLVAAALAAPDLGLPAHSWRLAEALRGYFDNRGHGVDGVAVGEAALAAARAEGDVDAEASLHDLLGLVHRNLSDYAAAVEHHRWALELSRGTGNRMVEAAALTNLGRAHSQLGQPAQAASFYEEALVINRAIGNRQGEAAALHYTGAAALSLGRPETAIERHTAALELSARIDHRQVQAAAAQGLGLAHWAMGDLRRAAGCYRRALAVCRRYGYRHGEVAMLVCLAETGLDAGEFVESAAQVRQALDLARQLGERRHEVSALDVLATIQQRTGEWSAAATHYTLALDLARKIRFGYGEASVLTGLCALRRRTGDPEGAIEHGLVALALMRGTGMRLLEGRALTELAHAFLDAGEATAAAEHAEQGLVVSERAGQRLSLARARHVRALVRQVSGDTGGAVADWRAALSVFAELRVPEEAHVRALLAASAGLDA